MNELLVSKYKNNLLAKRSKIFFASILDYFLVVIVTFILFNIVTSPITSVLPSFKENLNKLSEVTTDLYKIVDETRLLDYDEEDKAISDVDIKGRLYLTSLLKTSLYVYDEPYYTFKDGQYVEENVNFDDTFLNVDDGNYINDSLSYYFYTFKCENSSLNDYVYDDIDYKDDKSTYLYEHLLNFNNSVFNEYFVSEEEFKLLNIDTSSGLNRYNILSKNYRSYLLSYLVMGERNDSLTTIYTNLLNAYKNATQSCINEVETKFTPYIEKNNEFNNYYNNYAFSYLIGIIITYFVTFIILIIIFPLILKENRTIGIKVLKLGFSRIDELEPSLFNIVIKDIILFIVYFNSIIFTIFFVNMLPLTVFPLFNSGFNILQVILFSLLLLILSYVYLIFNKNHQTLSLLSSNLIIKNTEEFENARASEDNAN